MNVESRNPEALTDEAVNTENQNDYGTQVMIALAAVQQLFDDSAKLLQDCDTTIGEGKDSIFESVVTRDLSRSLWEPKKWMPAALYRYYDVGPKNSGSVEAVTICFQDDVKPPRFNAPLLIVARIQYAMEPGTRWRSVCQEWDVWDAFFAEGTPSLLNKVIPFQQKEEGREAWFNLIAVPLYSIKAAHDVARLMEKVRQDTASRLPS